MQNVSTNGLLLYSEVSYQCKTFDFERPESLDYTHICIDCFPSLHSVRSRMDFQVDHIYLTPHERGTGPHSPLQEIQQYY